MNAHHNTAATSPLRGSSPVASVAKRQAGPSIDLPLWAQPHRALIAAIIAEQPERTKVTTETCMGPASYGYRGRNAALLREVYALTFDRMLRHVGAAEFDSPQYHKRRDALLAFDRANNADAVISQVIA